MEKNLRCKYCELPNKRVGREDFYFIFHSYGICYIKVWWRKKNSKKAKRECSLIRKFRVDAIYIGARLITYAYFLPYAY